jgi:hypothetical protein
MAIPPVGEEERNYYDAEWRQVVIKQLVEEHVAFVKHINESACVRALREFLTVLGEE